MPAQAFTLEQVRTFIAVAEREHVTRAAASIHLTQGAVTQQIQLFERALQLQLFERVGRGVRLTDAGRSMIGPCRGLLRSSELLDEAARALRALDLGSLHVGASQTAAGHYLPSLLSAFAAAYPGVRLQVFPANTSVVCSQVAEGVLDCGLVEGEVDQHRLVDVALVKDEVLLVAAADHPVTAAPQLTPDQLARHVYLAREPGSGTEKLAEEMLGRGYERMRRVELGQLDAVRAAAVSGLGIAALPRVAIESELARRALVELPWTTRVRWIRAVRRNQSGGPALERFWELVINSLTN
jgi:DNA-binding transcriptional LysR family regulator